MARRLSRGLDTIEVRGAREHNLKGIDVSIPRDTFTVVTGVSGSGKSSLAFDTLCKEGQRRFLESLSAYARQFLGGMEKPRVDHVEGLSPTVSIDQRTVSRNPRSTVGTLTEIHDHLRLLYARLGTPHCPGCGREVTGETTDAITDRILANWEGAKIIVLAPLVRDRRGAYRKELETLRSQGYVRARIDGEIRRLDEVERLDRYKRHTLEVILDRLRPAPEKRGRLTEAVEAAARAGDGVVLVLAEESLHTFSCRRACVACGLDLPEVEPRLFSFNSPHGACPRCTGLGRVRGVDETLVVPDPSLSLAEGALSITSPKKWLTYCSMTLEGLGIICEAEGIPFDRPWSDLGKRQRRKILFGTGKRTFELHYTWKGETFEYQRADTRTFPGIIPLVEAAYKETGSRNIERRYLSEVPCPECEGTRLRPEARGVLFRGRAITALSSGSVSTLVAFFSGLDLTPREALIGRDLFHEIQVRLRFLKSVGLGYLTLDRSAPSLAGGEAQRIHLATQLGSRLRGVLYVLDEPSIGLHARDNHRLLQALSGLRDLGNTVIVVEHDEATLRAADHLVDLGPGPGRFGGEVVAEGSVRDLARTPASVTGQFLNRSRTIALPACRRSVNPERMLTVRGAAEHNLKGMDVSFPLGCFVVVTGVSGSGKSTLVGRILKRALARHFHRAAATPGRHRGLEGVEHLDKVIEISQTPIGRTPRSNPATYTKLYGHVRELFAATPEARSRGYDPGRFSFNLKGGRCEACKGAGVLTVEMQFLADVVVTCDTCMGRRFNAETLTVTYGGKSIDEVLEMSVDEARAFFGDIPALEKILSTLQTVGLGYLCLGQPTTTVSGGEAQRIKLASELRRPATGRTLYLLDEPTTGLHLSDVARLLSALGRLVDAGNTVVIIEHNLEVVKVADHLIDLGPEGGDAGGEVVVTGTPEAVASHEASYTGQALAPLLEPETRELAPGRRRRPRRRDESVIRVRGARTHNLKGVDVDIPVGSFTVVTGVSGSGKTSLAFDTLFAEGQRRFVESLSAYARRFLGRLDRAPVDGIEGLGPAIAIDQRGATRNPRSTVATVTEIHDYLRLLYARLGRPHCPHCDRVMKAWEPSTLAASLLRRHDGKGKRLQVLAPLGLPGPDNAPGKRTRKQLEGLRTEVLRAGFVRMLVGETLVDIRREAIPAEARQVGIHVVVDRLVLRPGVKARLAEAVETAFKVGKNRVGLRLESGEVMLHAASPACLEHGVVLDGDLTPRHFSFNSHVGACPACNGLGSTVQADVDRLIVRPDRPLLAGALHEAVVHHLYRGGSLDRSVVVAAIREAGGDPGRAWKSLPERVRKVVLHGTGDRKVKTIHQWSSGRKNAHLVWNTAWPGLVASVEKRVRKKEEETGQRIGLEEVMIRGVCRQCGGHRLNPLSRSVRVGKRRMGDTLALTVEAARAALQALKPRASEAAVAAPLLREIHHRLAFLADVGLGYLTLDRASATLSGGEAQRIRLATQIGNRLTGVLYVLDEPTIGLHPRDTARLIHTLKDLRDLGNTLVVVEHDETVIHAADHVVELGPGAGRQGGEVVAACSPRDLRKVEASPTGRLLRAKASRPAASRRTPRDFIQVKNARLHNLKNLDVEVPRGVVCVVTGVSGSGKSTLVMEVLAPQWRALEGTEDLKRVVVVDADPIGATPSSNPATYTGAFTSIREFYASLPESRVRGYKPGRFSFNTGEGRCEACEGRGHIRVEMHFLADVWIVCEACKGKRYNAATLGVQFKGRTIADILDTEVHEALELFRDFPRIRRPLEFLDRVGLGYVLLGQPANTLSGGEAQRVKLAAELGRRDAADTLYLLDEPTVGLHGSEVKTLLGVLQDLVDRGSSVVVIEHHPDVLCAADHIIDLGPEGGDAGGEVVVAGPPEVVAAHPTSHTGRFLRAYGLDSGKR